MQISKGDLVFMRRWNETGVVTKTLYWPKISKRQHWAYVRVDGCRLLAFVSDLRIIRKAAKRG